MFYVYYAYFFYIALTISFIVPLIATMNTQTSLVAEQGTL